jgi:hypothetical protein
VMKSRRLMLLLPAQDKALTKPNTTTAAATTSSELGETCGDLAWRW